METIGFVGTGAMGTALLSRLRIARISATAFDLAQAMIVITDAGKAKRIPIFGRRRATFESKRGADAYALELAKLWVDDHLWGGNGRG